MRNLKELEVNNNKNNPTHIAYILPNLFTAASCFFGILSAIASINDSFEKAIIYIFISMVLDGLDGRVARLTHTTSAFGVEFDSLCDLVAFGVAPAILFYCTLGQEYGRFGVLASALFVVFGAIRLARFNITTMTNEPNVFIGLPIPMAAVTVASWISLHLKFELNMGVSYTIFVFILGLLMVSNIRYPSFKKVNLDKTKFRKALVIAILILALLYVRPSEVMALVTIAYISYGIFRMILKFYIVKLRKR